jgi:hypothetical protein
MDDSSGSASSEQVPVNGIYPVWNAAVRIRRRAETRLEQSTVDKLYGRIFRLTPHDVSTSFTMLPVLFLMKAFFTEKS